MSKRRLVVVGNGMGGARFVEELVSCNAVSKGRIVKAVLAGARGLRAIRDRTRASTGCGSCTPEVQKIIDFACGGVLPYVGARTHGHGRA